MPVAFPTGSRSRRARHHYIRSLVFYRFILTTPINHFHSPFVACIPHDCRTAGCGLASENFTTIHSQHGRLERTRSTRSGNRFVFSYRHGYRSSLLSLVPLVKRFDRRPRRWRVCHRCFLITTLGVRAAVRRHSASTEIRTRTKKNINKYWFNIFTRTFTSKTDIGFKCFATLRSRVHDVSSSFLSRRSRRDLVYRWNRVQLVFCFLTWSLHESVHGLKLLRARNYYRRAFNWFVRRF